MAKAGKALGLVLLLLVLSQLSGSNAPARGGGAAAAPPPGRRPASRRRNPFPPQPEPTDEDLATEPTALAYPTYADLLWIEYGRNTPDREGPKLSALDETPPKGPRSLTAFERWALAPHVPQEFVSLLSEQITSDGPRPRFERWALARLVFDLARSLGASDEHANQLQQRVGRSLYVQARDFYRRNS